MKKNATFKRISLVIACSMLVVISNAQLLVNGPIFNSVGTGPSGTDESWCFDVSLLMGNFGYGASSTSFYRVADDFTVPVGVTWNIDSLYFYCYQTGASTGVSSITAVNIRVLNDNAGAPGSTVVWGDTTTNRLGRSVWTNGYRTLESTTGTAITRPIFKNVCGTPSLSLPAGTYWLDWQYTGQLASGPWANPITITGNATTGNGMQVLGAQNPYLAVMDAGSATPQGFPFSIFGTVISGIESAELIKNISVYPNPANNFVNVQLNLASEMPVGIEILNALGEVVYSVDNGKQVQISQQIDCSGIASGFYFMKVRVGNEFVVKKFTKE